MPTYDFRCPRGHEFEQFFRKISDAPLEVPCPECGETAARQLSAGAGLLFKGSGFYLTDYGKNAHRKAAPSGGGGDKAKSGESSGSSGGGGGAGGGGGSGESKSESKPAESKSTESKPSKPAGGPKSSGSGGSGAD
jgi:putative FmdB family regulatory protein